MEDMSLNPLCGHEPSTLITQMTYNPVFYCIIPSFYNLRMGLQKRSREQTKIIVILERDPNYQFLASEVAIVHM
jgi:hypothetical protein